MRQVDAMYERTGHIAVKKSIVGVTEGKSVNVFNGWFAAKKGLETFDSEEEAINYLSN